MFINIEFFNQYLSFSLGKEIYAITTRHIDKIIKIPQIHSVPQSNEVLEGVINYNDNLINLFNLRKLLQLPWKEYSYDSGIIVIQDDQWTFGILVDKILDLLIIHDDEIIETPNLLRNLSIPYIAGFYQYNNQNYLIIDIDLISKYLISSFK
ncbi:MAG: chemotaxis protein CheW [Promethearchaeota archaeon]